MSTKQDKPEQKVAQVPTESVESDAVKQTFYFPAEQISVEATTLEEATKIANETARKKEDKK